MNAAKKSLSKHLLLRDGIIEAKKGKLARKARKERKSLAAFSLICKPEFFIDLHLEA